MKKSILAIILLSLISCSVSSKQKRYDLVPVKGKYVFISSVNGNGFQPFQFFVLIKTGVNERKMLVMLSSRVTFVEDNKAYIIYEVSNNSDYASYVDKAEIHIPKDSMIAYQRIGE